MNAAGSSKVVVTGGAGGFGRVVVPHLLDQGLQVHAVDVKPAFGHGGGAGATFHQADILKRGFDDVLRRVHPDALIHFAMIRRFERSWRERHRINFEGTAKVIEAALARGVKKIVIASRATVYGALPDQPQFLTEDHPPAAGRMFADMQDLVAADLYACGKLWQHPEVEIVVLRLVNTLGPRVSTMLQRYLSRPRVFTVLGFDPIYQVVHENDMAMAVSMALEPGLRGIFNVTGPGEVPLHVLVEESGGLRVPLPESMIRLLRGRAGFPSLPAGAIEFLKHSCTVDGSRFARETGFQPIFDLRSTLREVRENRRRL